MNVNNFVSKQLAYLEGKKSQARIGDLREVVKLLKKQHAQARKCGEVSLLQLMFEDAEAAAVKRHGPLRLLGLFKKRK